MIGTFKYTANMDMFLGISDQQTNAPAVLLAAGSKLSKVLWFLDEDAGTIALVKSKNTLVLGVESVGARAQIVLQEKKPGNVAQTWDFTSKPNFILSGADKSYVIDDSNRGTTPGTPIQLYAFNGSPAQQWTFIPMDTTGSEVMAQLDTE